MCGKCGIDLPLLAALGLVSIAIRACDACPTQHVCPNGFRRRDKYKLTIVVK